MDVNKGDVHRVIKEQGPKGPQKLSSRKSLKIPNHSPIQEFLLLQLLE